MKKMIRGTYSEMRTAVRSIRARLNQMRREKTLEDKTWYKEFKALITKLQQHLSSESRNKHGQSHKTCLQSLANFRANTACDVCSGNAAHFFTPEKKIKLSEDMCRDLIQKCQPSWQETSKLVKRMNIVLKFSEKIAAVNNTAVLDNSMSEILKTWTEENKISKFLNNCQVPEEHETCTGEQASYICRKMLKITGNSFVDAATEEKLKNQSKPMKNAVSGPRRLESESWDYSIPEGEEQLMIVDTGLCEDPSYGCASENNWASA